MTEGTHTLYLTPGLLLGPLLTCTSGIYKKNRAEAHTHAFDSCAHTALSSHQLTPEHGARGLSLLRRHTSSTQRPLRGESQDAHGGCHRSGLRRSTRVLHFLQILPHVFQVKAVWGLFCGASDGHTQCQTQEKAFRRLRNQAPKQQPPTLTGLLEEGDWLPSPPRGWHGKGASGFTALLPPFPLWEEHAVLRIQEMRLSQDRLRAWLSIHFKLSTKTQVGTGRTHKDRSTAHLTWALTASSFGSVCHRCGVGACVQDQKLLRLDG